VQFNSPLSLINLISIRGSLHRKKLYPLPAPYLTIELYTNWTSSAPNHVSFKAQGGPWPPHCIQNSKGAEFHPNLKLPEGTFTVSKAMDPLKESYTGFDGTTLDEALKEKSIKRVFVGGLATDYCVKNTVLDAIERGFETILLLDATRAINAKPDDADKAIYAMVAKGAETATLTDFPKPTEIAVDKMDDQSLGKAEKKTKARLRSRGPYRKARIEHWKGAFPRKHSEKSRSAPNLSEPYKYMKSPEKFRVIPADFSRAFHRDPTKLTFKTLRKRLLRDYEHPFFEFQPIYDHDCLGE
jgi:nicotinamidase-related amidase